MLARIRLSNALGSPMLGIRHAHAVIIFLAFCTVLFMCSAKVQFVSSSKLFQYPACSDYSTLYIKLYVGYFSLCSKKSLFFPEPGRAFSSSATVRSSGLLGSSSSSVFLRSLPLLLLNEANQFHSFGHLGLEQIIILNVPRWWTQHWSLP